MNPSNATSRQMLIERLEQRCLFSVMHPSAPSPFLSHLTAAPTQSVSTVPASGDQNPYGVAFVPNGFARGGPLQPGDILVSNFNNTANNQGTGTTIIRETPAGQTSVFFQGPSGLGLTTALGVLKRGFVIVGSAPTLNGDGMHEQPPGSLLILDRHGNIVTTLADQKLLDGPWDLTVQDQGSRALVFVANVLNGTVSRINLALSAKGDAVKVLGMTQIASGYAFRTDPSALVVGPTGLAYDHRRQLLYVASTADNAIFAIKHAATTGSQSGTGDVIYKDDVHLRGPLGLAFAPNGDLLTANGDAVTPTTSNGANSGIVEFSPKGLFVDEITIHPNPDAAFGIALSNSGSLVRFAAVNDNTNMLEVWNVSRRQL